MSAVTWIPVQLKVPRYYCCSLLLLVLGFVDNVVKRKSITLLTETAAVQNQIALSYRTVLVLYFLAVVFEESIHSSLCCGWGHFSIVLLLYTDYWRIRTQSVLSYQLKLIKMRAKLASPNYCAVPILSLAAVNLCGYYYI